MTDESSIAIYRIAGLHRARMVNLVLVLVLFVMLAGLGLYLVHAIFQMDESAGRGVGWIRYEMWFQVAGLIFFGYIAYSSLVKPGAYILTDDVLEIHFQYVHSFERIDDMEWARIIEPEELKGRYRVGGRSFVYKAVGLTDLVQIWNGTHEKLGPIMMCAVKGQRCVALKISEMEELLIISPEDPEGFVADLERRGVGRS